MSNALSLHATALEKMQVRTQQISALQLSVDYTQELLQNGFAVYNEVITARQSLLAAELGSIADQFQRLQAAVNLYRSLGGGGKLQEGIQLKFNNLLLVASLPPCFRR